MEGFRDFACGFVQCTWAAGMARPIIDEMIPVQVDGWPRHLVGRGCGECRWAPGSPLYQYRVAIVMLNYGHSYNLNRVF